MKEHQGADRNQARCPVLHHQLLRSFLAERCQGHVQE